MELYGFGSIPFTCMGPPMWTSNFAPPDALMPRYPKDKAKIKGKKKEKEKENVMYMVWQQCSHLSVIIFTWGWSDRDGDNTIIKKNNKFSRCESEIGVTL